MGYLIVSQIISFKFRIFLKLQGVFCFEIYPSAVLVVKSLAQRTLVRFRRHFTFALLRNKFLGEKCGLGLDGSKARWDPLKSGTHLQKNQYSRTLICSIACSRLRSPLSTASSTDFGIFKSILFGMSSPRSKGDTDT